MDVTRVVITDMPGLSWVEFLLQWGALLVQAAAAAGTVWAVLVALKVSRRDGEWRQKQEQREAAMVWEVVYAQTSQAYNTLLAVTGLLDDLLDPKTRPRPAHQRLERLAALEPNLAMEPLWRTFDKASWLPQEVGSELGRLLAMTPTYLIAVRQLLEWQGSVPTLVDQATVTRDLGLLLVKGCESIMRAHPPSRDARRASS